MEREWLIPDYPPLKCDDAVGKAAVEGQTYYYPKVVRSKNDPPIAGQSLGALSFQLFKEPRTLKNGSLVFGFVKLRGNWGDESQARFQTSKIIREVDSKHQIKIGPVGAWLPITEEQAVIKEKVDVRTGGEERHLRDEAAKEKRAEQRRIMREIREREEELREKGDIYDDPTSLTFYSMKRVTELKLTEARNNQERQLEGMKASLRKVRKELKRLEIEHPEYSDQWIDRYNEERRKGGVPDYVPGENEFEEYEKTVFESLEDSEEED